MTKEEAKNKIENSNIRRYDKEVLMEVVQYAPGNEMLGDLIDLVENYSDMVPYLVQNYKAKRAASLMNDAKFFADIIKSEEELADSL